MLRYTVDHAFYAELNGENVYFTRENADRVKELSREKRNELLEVNAIREFNDRKGELPEGDISGAVAPPAS